MKILNENDITVLVLEEDIQGQQIEELSNVLQDLKSKRIDQLALDMSQVGYIYSRGIGVLVRAQKDFQSEGGSLYLFNLKSSVQKILMEINLMDYLNGYATKEEMEYELLKNDPSKDEPSLELGLHIFCSESTLERTTFILTGTIDSESDLLNLTSECNQKIESGFKHIRFILTDLIYIDDHGVLEWKKLRDKLAESSGSLTLTDMNEIILDQLKIMGLQTSFIFSE